MECDALDTEDLHCRHTLLQESSVPVVGAVLGTDRRDNVVDHVCNEGLVFSTQQRSSFLPCFVKAKLERLAA